MKKICIAGAAAATVCCTSPVKVTRMQDLPDPLGRSGHYAAEVNGRLMVAGGCNFPDVPVREGGRKAFYKDVHALREGEWTLVAELPEPSAYGAFFNIGDKLVIAGGANSSGTLKTVVSVSADGCVESLPELEHGVQQAFACSGGGKVLLVGGMSDDPAYAEVLAFEDGVFRHFATLPEPLVQPLAFYDGNVLRVWGGLNPGKNMALDYGYEFSGEEWKKIPGLSQGRTLTGAAGTVLDGHLYVTGGVDMKIINDALPLKGEAVREYQSHEPEWYRFRKELMMFDPADGSWSNVGSSVGFARAGAVLLPLSDGSLVNIGGELMPGIRSAEMWRINLK